MRTTHEPLNAIWNELERAASLDIRAARRRRRHATLVLAAALMLLAVGGAIAAPNSLWDSIFSPDKTAKDQVTQLPSPTTPPAVKTHAENVALENVTRLATSLNYKVDDTAARSIVVGTGGSERVIAVVPTETGRLCYVIVTQAGGGAGSCRASFSADNPTALVGNIGYDDHTSPAWAAGILPDGIKHVWIITDSGRHAAQVQPNIWYWNNNTVDYPHAIEVQLPDGSVFHRDFPAPATGDPDAVWEQQHGIPTWRAAARAEPYVIAAEEASESTRSK